MSSAGDRSRPRHVRGGAVVLAVLLSVSAVVGGGLVLGAIAVDAFDTASLSPVGTDPLEQSVGVAASDRPTDSLTPGEELNRTELERSVHGIVNRERIDRGLPPLRMDRDLRAVARRHSRDMAAKDYVSHEQPDGDTMADRYAEAGIRCRVPADGGEFATGAENIVYTHYDAPIRKKGGVVRHTTPTELAEAIVTLWMNSPPHRENMLKPYWNHEGIGISLVTTDASTRVYVTQNFC